MGNPTGSKLGKMIIYSPVSNMEQKDRFIRFGYDWYENFLKRYDVDIVVVNNEKLSLQEELVQDLISIDVFSCYIDSLKQQNKNQKGEATRKNIDKQVIKVQKLQ